jgi:hypothetical protein
MKHPSKSQSETLCLELFEKLFLDLQTRFPSETKSLRRDLVTIKSRVRDEGLSFLTKTLPKLGKAFDSYLENGIFNIPREFKSSHMDRSIPAFMQGMFKIHLSSVESGQTNVDIVRCIRQVLFLVYKLELPYSPSQEKGVIDAFIKTEDDLRNVPMKASLSSLGEVRRLIERVLAGFDPKEITPRHGPGAVATGERLEQKWTFARLYSNLHQEYPYYRYFIAGGARELSDRRDWYLGLSRLSSGCAKVVLVPKDSRGPRLISCEPLEYQWIQQGIGRSLMRHLEGNSLTKGHVNFIDQSVNAELARSSSLFRDYCTLDLKEASDRVSLTHIDLFFPEHIRRALLASRTTSTKLPSGEILTLEKFAPMGSALCFPVEALIFWAVSVVAVCRSRRLSVERASRTVFVYGDDIIVSTCDFSAVTEALDAVGLKVNVDKSFRKGFFRESCGTDAYKGVSVTPVRIRTLWSGNAGDGNSLASYAAYANALNASGFSTAAQFLFSRIEQVYGRLPWGTPDSAYPNRNCHSGFKALILNLELGFKVRCSETHHPEVKVKVLKAKRADSQLDGWTRLLRDMVVSYRDLDPSLVVLPRSAHLRTSYAALC